MPRLPTPALAPLLPLVLLGGGCAFPEDPGRWSEQLSPAGPCWRVDLLDGLDEQDTSELRDLYDCVNRQGAIAPLAPVMDALDTDGRSGDPLGVELARLVNRLPEVDVDLLGWAGAALDLFEDDDAPLQGLLEVAVELVYATPYETVAGWDAWTMVDASRLEDGVIAPLLPVLAEAAGAVLDDGPAVPGLLAEILDDPVVADTACTLAGLAESTDPEVAALGARLVSNLGDALVAAGDASNDRWGDASGNSLRDLFAALLVDRGEDGRTTVAALELPVLALLDDDRVVDNLASTMDAARAADRLAPLPGQLRYLSTVDVDGGDRSVGEDSALTSLVRLMASANTEVDCSIDLIVTELEIELGNLSVSLLTYLADQDPDAAAGGIDLLGDILGWGLTGSTLDLVASTGVCPVIDEQLVTDLGSIDRLSDDQVGDLLIVLLMVLDDARDGTQDRLPDLVDLFTLAWDRELVPPVEEALLDLGDSDLAADLAVVIGFGLEPEVLTVDSCPTGSAPIDFDGTLGLVRAAVAGRPGGSPTDVLRPLAGAVIDRPETWQAAEALGALATDSGDARLHDLPDLMARVLAADPELGLLADLGPVLEDPDLYEPVLHIAESPALADALAASTDPAGSGEPGVLPWVSRLITGGTVDSVLQTVDLVLDLLSDPD